jgi:hypothetical protein
VNVAMRAYHQLEAAERRGYGPLETKDIARAIGVSSHHARRGLYALLISGLAFRDGNRRYRWSLRCEDCLEATGRAGAKAFCDRHGLQERTRL